MRKIVSATLLSMVLCMMLVPFVFAEAAGTTAPAEAVAAPVSDAKLNYFAMAVLGCGIAIGVAAFGAAIAQGLGLSRACEGVARNPGASGKITTTLIIGLAMIESLAIYALVVVLIVFFVDPFKILK
ncbi:MAG: ATP synthase F0 subunit C [Nitrospirae bacterium]|nr:ATP synthase F0 subunit C [Nitrospirota bacterium]